MMMASAFSFDLLSRPPPSSLQSPGSGLSAFRRISTSTGSSSRRKKPVPGVRAMAGPKYKGTQIREKRLTEMIEDKVSEAKEICEGDTASDECKVAWDEVEEVSQAKADLRLKLEIEKQDPLESFCNDNPETDECRVYDD